MKTKCVLLVVMCLLTMANLTDAQQLWGKWVVPITNGNHDHATKLLSFIDNGIQVSGLSQALSSPTINCDFAGGGYESESYALEYFIIDKYICYGQQMTLWNNLIGPEDMLAEFQIINYPGQENHYLMFYSEYEGNDKTNYVWLRYRVIEIVNEVPQVSQKVNLIESDEQSEYIAFAITEEYNEERYIYAISQHDSLVPCGIKRWMITENGVTNQEIVLGVAGSSFNPEDFSAYNMELKELGGGDVTLAWVTNNSSTNDMIFFYDDGVEYSRDLNFGKIGGIEFSKINDDIVYVSCNQGIIAYDYVNAVVDQYLSSSDDYERTFLQTAPDGHIYGVSNDGNRLSRINMSSGIFQEDIVTFPYEYEVSTFRDFGGYHYYILPENERKIDTLSASIELVHVCPGDSTGSATVTVSGGIPDYTYTWDYWDAVEEEWVELTGITSNYTGQVLWEGLFKCVIEDAVGNIFTIEFTITAEYIFNHGDFVIIDEDQVWNSYDFTYYKGIKILKGYELVVNDSRLQFSKAGKIIIEDSARLIVNNSILTYYEDCDDKWQGIEVWGRSDKHQYEINGGRYQGYLELNDNSEVSYAEFGISLYKSYLDPNSHERIIADDSAGGIVRSRNTNFINNTKSIHFIPYENYHPYQPGTPMANLSIFKLDTFDINMNNIGPSIFYKHVDLSRVDGIKFEGCTFTNTDVNFISDWSLGIAAYNAGFEVKSGCEQQVVPCPEQYLVPSKFMGFCWGIGSYGTMDSPPFSVKDAYFDDNYTGIIISEVDYSIVTDSYFEVGYNSPKEGESCPLDGIGIDLQSSAGFAIEDNEFTKNNHASLGFYTGIRVLNCPSEHDIIYRNSFSNLSFGNYAEGENRSNPNDDQKGVEYQCNSNSNNAIDFIVINYDMGLESKEGMIRTYQGSPTEACGNTFSSSATWHFRNEGTQNIDWFYYRFNPDEEPLYYFSFPPAYFTPYPIDYENNCAEHYSGNESFVLTGGQRQQLELEYYQALNDYNSAHALYESLIDGGNTDNELSDIQNSQPDDMWDMREQLLGHSPHLSQDVLRTMSDRTDVFPDDVLLEILSANPDELNKDSLLNYLETKEDPLPEYMIDILVQAAQGITYKTILKREMAGYHAEKSKSAQDIIRSILADSSCNLNDYRNWLDNLGNIEADKRIAESYVNEGDTSSAMALLNLIPDLYELEGENLIDFNHYKDLIQMQINWEVLGTNIFSLDSSDIVLLETYANGNYRSVRQMARNILIYAYNYHYCDCLNAPDSSYLKDLGSNYSGFNSAFGPEVTVEPNPAHTYVTFDYKLGRFDSVGLIKIVDLYGNEIHAIEIQHEQGQYTWDTRFVSPGVYFYTLVSNGKSKSGKIIIR